MSPTPRARPSSAPPLRIIGIDPGSHRTGFGVVEIVSGRLRFVEAGAVQVNPRLDLATRLVQIHHQLVEHLARLEPREVAVEGLFHAKNARSALVLGHVRGVVLLAAAQRGLPVHEYAPREVKKALVGNGNAEKHQVQRMIQLLLGLPAPLRPLDAADGAAIAVCHAHARKLRSIGQVAPGAAQADATIPR